MFGIMFGIMFESNLERSKGYPKNMSSSVRLGSGNLHKKHFLLQHLSPPLPLAEIMTVPLVASAMTRSKSMVTTACGKSP